MLSYEILASAMHGKKLKSNTKPRNLKYLLQHGMTNLHYLIDHILYLIYLKT